MTMITAFDVLIISMARTIGTGIDYAMFICNHCREELAQAGGVTGRGDRAGIADAVGMVLDDRRKTIIASPRAPKATLVARAATKPHKGACPPTPNHLIGTQT
ncbi:hypothetical protein A2J03_19740 [Rhodococcus sp. EPR-157]|jgi:hypothetical protein|uniref:hypothetical protein n=1 Tax=Rhodococcus sp. EPR-157 TaxID=1813677 RepID=UPI0007BC3208|nr:hypothetical protein [Rhodococcus sp. EPR-157]KZF11150.1 hypothetical protein A2J03_19740 [Rhodococcus sp. EPR-157]OLT32994.1 hypothetical protein BJF84_24620 [Rhodococcus sp. CUA-806]OLT33849.1 hypothetical protein BJF84_21005 [Rhodococcus sp. CUA-806]